MPKPKPLAVVILAAGKGTRMKSSKPKVMHELLGLPMINWLLRSVEELSPEKVVVVVGENMPDLVEAVKPHETVIQKEQLGQEVHNPFLQLLALVILLKHLKQSFLYFHLPG